MSSSPKPDIKIVVKISSIDTTAQQVVVDNKSAMSFSRKTNKTNDLMIEWLFKPPSGVTDLEVDSIQFYKPSGSPIWPDSGGVIKSTQNGVTGRNPWVQVTLDHDHMPTTKTCYTYKVYLSHDAGGSMVVDAVDPSMTLEPWGGYAY